MTKYHENPGIYVGFDSGRFKTGWEDPSKMSHRKKTAPNLGPEASFVVNKKYSKQKHSMWGKEKFNHKGPAWTRFTDCPS